MTHENGKLFIEFKPPVTDEAIDIRKLANKLVEGQADGGQIIQIFVKLKTMGMVKGTMAPGSSYTFKDTPIMQGLSPKGKVDVSFLYNLGFVKKPANVVVEPPKQAEGGFDLFKAVGDFFGSLFQFRSSDVKENVVEVKRVDDKITIPATKQKMDYSEFQNEKWLNYQNKYYIAEPDGSGSGDGLYLK
ncbi:MAG: hypothetical protein JXR70_15740, partial [Spirochaetales bacterium]|nr:hypothetical protein [Spirochaetales bacterium]